MCGVCRASRVVWSHHVAALALLWVATSCISTWLGGSALSGLGACVRGGRLPCDLRSLRLSLPFVSTALALMAHQN